MFIPLVAFTQDGTEPIRTTDLLMIKTMSGIDISPDGRQVVYVVTSMGKGEKEEYRYFRHLWIKDLEKQSPPVQLTYGQKSDGSPVWSPDGNRIAFIRQHKTRPQIWILPLKGGEAYRITGVEYGASQPLWSPDGTKLLFSSSIPAWAVDEDPTWPSERPGRKVGDIPNWKKIEKKKKDKKDAEPPTANPGGTLAEIRAWLAKNSSQNNPRVFNRLDLHGERQLQTGMSFQHLFVVEAKPEAEAHQVTKGKQSFGGADWSPDGKRIICSSVRYQEHPDRVRDGDLWIMNADGSGLEVFLDWKDYIVFVPLYSPDGKTILFLTLDQNDPGFSGRQLALISAEGENARGLTFDFDRRISSYCWSPDGKYVYFTAPSEGSFPLYRISEKGGKVETVIKGSVGVRGFDVSGKNIVYALTEVKNPFELYTADVDGKNPRQISTFNSPWIKNKRIVFPEEKWITRPDGKKIQYWVVEPAIKEEGKKYPLVLEIHGGPSSMWGPGEFTMWHEFQLLASWGYGIVYCNPRGSGGYGYDFRKANYRNWGTGPAGDILAAAGEAAKLEWADANKQVVTGGSYAGYMTAWIVSQDHRFKAAVAQRGVYELSVFFGEGRAWRLVPNHFGGYPWEKEARGFLDANSPQTFVNDITTPLLIMHSDEDIRTGVVQSEFLYKSLKALNKPVEYVRYPGEGHELSRSGNPKRRMDRLNRIIEFFERFIEH
jgi:dipeptidyl aminopeptidase/acylaminoacyl peptidase